MPYLKTLLFIVVIPGLVVIGFPYLIASVTPEALTLNFGSTRYLAILPWTVGAAVLLWCAWDFAARGQGTPAPVDPPKELIVQGLYRYVRNPMYVGVLIAVLGQFLWFGSLWLVAYALYLLISFHMFVTRYEEPNLQRRFGESYRRYMNEVPRWVPRLE